VTTSLSANRRAPQNAGQVSTPKFETVSGTLIKISTNVVSHGDAAVEMAEVAVSRYLFANILVAINRFCKRTIDEHHSLC
jgi:hypothetical protein